ncbi:MAG: leucine-rich repeat domain-containing protein [Deltaproteobacteria bacterium]|jgi:hypothetical protein|nr:leucine-rich repeat domain-containing protein [Deltaproteobacteria bacterium]
MKKSLEVKDPQSVVALLELILRHPEAGFRWDVSQPLKVIASDEERFALREENGRLTALNLSNAKLKGRLWIEDVPSLEYLRISCPNVTQVKLKNLPGLTNLVLENLDLAHNKQALYFEDLPNLRSLRVNGSGLTYLQPLSVLASLESLDLAENRVKSLSPLTALKKLKKLALAQNLVSNVGPLRKLKSLEELDLTGNKLKTLAELDSLPKLKALWLSHNKLGGYDFLAPFTKLQELGLNGFGPKAVKYVSPLTGLKRLELRDNGLDDLGFLRAFPELTGLDLSDNDITELAGLMACPKLTHLSLNRNAITHIGPLSKLGSLRELNLGHNSISDLAPLKWLLELEQVDLRSNDLENLDPLNCPPNLIRVNLAGNERLTVEAMDNLSDDLENLTHFDSGHPKVEDFPFAPPSRRQAPVAPPSRHQALVALNQVRMNSAAQKLAGLSEAKEPNEKGVDLLARLLDPPDDPELRAELFKAFVEKVLAGELTEAEYKRALFLKKPFGFDPLGEGDFDDDDTEKILAKLEKLTGQGQSKDPGELLGKAQPPDSDEPPDDAVIYNSLEEIEGLPPELIRILKQIGGGEPTMVKVKKIKRGEGFGGLPNLPKGTVLIRCQVERDPFGDEDDDHRSLNHDQDQDPDQDHDHGHDHGHNHDHGHDHDPERQGDFDPGEGPPSNLNFNRLTGFGDAARRSDYTFPFFRRKSGPDNTYTRKDEEEYLRVQKIFLLLDYNPSKFSLH